MTAFQHTLKALLEGQKTETSRLVHPGDYTWMCGEMPAPWNPHGYTLLYSSVHHPSSEPRFVAGKDYAIQPGRAKKQVGRYMIENIWRQDVRTLTNIQTKAEGMDEPEYYHFIQLWASMHDPAFEFRFDPSIIDYRIKVDRQRDIVAWDTLQTVIQSRPRERYQAWRMSIRVLWETVDWDAPIIAALQIDPNAHIIENKFSS